MNRAEKFIHNKLDQRRAEGLYRALKTENTLIDFCSNDYLGFARQADLKKLITEEIKAHDGYPIGATGSRLISGNSAYIEDLESSVAAFHGAEAGLIYNSGYDANVGLFSCLPQKGDTVITDQLAHASIIDGTRLSFANRYSFRHNDLSSLEEKLKQAKGICYVVIESVYSMDGDTPPIADMIALTEKYQAQLIVDEAHAVGMYNKGLVHHLGLQDRVFARVVTFGKALGCHGAIVLGSSALREYLINFSRSFIYTTASSFHDLVAIKMAYKYLGDSEGLRLKLKENIQLFKLRLKSAQMPVIPSDSPIQCLLAGSNQKAKDLATHLQKAGLDVRPILSPTVAAGTERIRICIHAFNTSDELILLTDTINHYLG